MGDTDCSEECFESELRACSLAAKEFGLELKSFIFPLGMIGHLDILRANGFVAYAGNIPQQISSLPRIARWINYSLHAGPTFLPEEDTGLWHLPKCLSYCPHYWASAPVVTLQVWKAKKAVRVAALERRLFHLSFHPFELSIGPDRLFRGLEDIFAEVCRYRDAGLLDNLNMGQLAEALQHAKMKTKISGPIIGESE